MQNKIQIYVKESFGTPHFYAVKSAIVDLMHFANNQKTLTDKEIMQLSQAGYVFELVPNPQYVEYLKQLTV